MASLGYVRNNPWIQQDRMRTHDRGPVPQTIISHPHTNGITTDQYKSIPGDPLTNNQSIMTTKVNPIHSHQDLNGDQMSEANSEQSCIGKDLDYGPGIVSRLRQKFLQMAVNAAHEAETEKDAFYTKHKSRRCASVDDLLDDRPMIEVVQPRTPQPPQRPSLTPKKYSQSSSSLHTGFPSLSPKPVLGNGYDKPGTLPDPPSSPPEEPTRSVEQFSAGETLASLRKRFEVETKKPALKPKPAAVNESFLNTKPVANLESGRRKSSISQGDDQPEPEFLKISRHLRKVESVSEDTKTPDFSRNPPDPDVRSPYGYPCSTTMHQLKLDDRSPPPEEPLPPPIKAAPQTFANFNNTPNIISDESESDKGSTKSDLKSRRLFVEQDLMGFSSETSAGEERTSPGPLLRGNKLKDKEEDTVDATNHNSDSLDEIQQLLSKFDKSKWDSRHKLPPNADPMPSEEKIPSPVSVANDILLDLLEPTNTLAPEPAEQLMDDKPIPLINLDPPSSLAHANCKERKGYSMANYQENIIYEPSITLEPLSSSKTLLHESMGNESSDSDSSSREGEHNGFVGEFRPNHTPPDILSHTNGGLDESIERSVFVQHLDTSKLKKIEMIEKETTQSFLELEEMGPIVAGDGNMISHSFLSLVNEEDVSALLEPDDESVYLEFEGEFGMVPIKSNLIPSKERGSRGSLDFHPETVHTRAYTYLDEEAALITEAWEPGIELNHNQYIQLKNEINNAFLAKRIAQVEQELRARASGQGLMNTPEVGKKSDGGLVSFVPAQLTTSDYQLGDADQSSWDYGRVGGESTVSNGSSSDETITPEIRPEEEGNAFSKVESQASDLLF